jgi:Na+/H+ antiporter NhaD/arsenite permease-like protein
MSDLTTIAAYSIFIGSYIVFALGKFPGMKIDRPGAAIIGAVLRFAIGAVRPSDALHFVHFGTVVLLFSMMLVVAHLHLAGFFDWITELVVTRLKPHHLLPTVIFLSGLLSAFFVNDIICLVMVPFVLTATRRMGVKPVPQGWSGGCAGSGRIPGGLSSSSGRGSRCGHHADHADGRSS